MPCLTSPLIEFLLCNIKPFTPQPFPKHRQVRKTGIPAGKALCSRMGEASTCDLTPLASCHSIYIIAYFYADLFSPAKNVCVAFP